MIRALLAYLLAQDKAAPRLPPPKLKPKKGMPETRRDRRARACLLKRDLRRQARRGNKDAGELRKAMLPQLVHTQVDASLGLMRPKVRNARKRQRKARR